MGPRECVYTGSADKTAKAWSTRSGKCLLTYRGHSGPITQITVDKNGHILYTASLDATVRSWFAESAKPQFVFVGHKSEVISLVVAEKMLYTGSTDRTARSWLLSNGALVRIYRGHKRTVNAVEKVDKYVITVSDDGHVRCFEEKTGSVCHDYGNKTTGGCSTFVTTDQYVITAGNNGLLVVWPRWVDKSPDELVAQAPVAEG
ncbi:WD repeat-containing protein 86 [Fasciola gigantica]|uniref:WD repeat-containing protein 86 n=1 Tax=Fasciola gigantica TaxID=46835 RepID=A0A504Y5G3_FASGI|nr:WD repeat-containing protein 86 [Fasciola gigantica]